MMWLSLLAEIMLSDSCCDRWCGMSKEGTQRRYHQVAEETPSRGTSVSGEVQSFGGAEELFVPQSVALG